MCVSEYIQSYLCVHAFMYAIHIYIYICMYEYNVTYIYTYTHVHMSIQTCVHVHTQSQPGFSSADIGAKEAEDLLVLVGHTPQQKRRPECRPHLCVCVCARATGNGTRLVNP